MQHLNAEARQPTGSVGSISPPRALRSAPNPHLVSQARPTSRKWVWLARLTPTNDEIILYSIMSHRKGGRNLEKKCCILRISPTSIPPTLRFVLRPLRLQKGGGGVFAGHYGNLFGWLLAASQVGNEDEVLSLF